MLRYDFEGPAPALSWRRGEPQPARALLVQDGERLWIYTHYQGDGLPERIYFGRVPHWPIEPFARRERLEAVLDSVRPELDRLARDPADGDAREVVAEALAAGGLTPDGEYDPEAIVNAWWAADWLSASHIEWLWPPEQPLDAVVRDLAREAESQGVYLVDGPRGLREALMGKLRSLDQADVPSGSAWEAALAEEEEEE